MGTAERQRFSRVEREQERRSTRTAQSTDSSHSTEATAPLRDAHSGHLLLGPSDLLVLQRAAGNRAVSQLIGTSLVAAQVATVQRGRGPRTPRSKKRSKAPTRYFRVTIKDDIVTRIVLLKRPPSSSRRGQGDHVVAFSLVVASIEKAMLKNTVAQAAENLAGVLEKTADRVIVAPTNRWWHTYAGRIKAMLTGGDLSADELKAAVNDLISLVNQAPGTAVKNPQSTGGHGESTSKGGLQHAERQVAMGRAVKGNVWTNILGLIDLAARSRSSLHAVGNTLRSDLENLITNVSTTAPTLYGLIKAGNTTLAPETDLTKAVASKFSNKSARFRTDLVATLNTIVSSI